jgi:arylsulfatase A-like enzyme/Flp pilus assembly protein TadD
MVGIVRTVDLQSGAGGSGTRSEDLPAAAPRMFCQGRALRIRLLMLACVLAPLAALSLAGAPAWAKDPDVVLITIDTVRADHVGCYGDREARTPNLDALSRDGVLFRTAVASVPLTLPSHCSILTGAYPPLHGVRDNLGYSLGETPPTLASILKQRGYSTAAFVGADVLDPKRGLNRGFDTYSCPMRRKMGRDNPVVFNLQELRRRAEDVVNDALDWMSAGRARSGAPWFVWIHLYDPHTPYNPPDRFRDLVQSPYDGAIAYADSAVGRVFDYLKQQGLYDSSLIVATSDHGESFGEHGEYAHGYFIYDTTLLVPLIVKPPVGSGVAVHRIETAVRSIDIAPTVLQFLGVPAQPTMQGSGLLSMMLGKETNASAGAAYCETYYPTEFGWSPLRALRSGRFKYIDAPKPELYDLVADPGELHNLYRVKSAVANELSAQLRGVLSKIGPKAGTPGAHATPTDIALLASLGYLGTSTAVSVDRKERLPDPKDELATYKVLSSSAQMAAEGKCVRAIPLLTHLVEEQPSLLFGYLTLGKCQLATGDYDSAARALDSALRLRPDNLEAAFYKGICQFQRGQFEESLSTLQPLVKALPEEPYLHLYLGMIYERQKNSEAALAEFQECANANPGFEVAVYKAGYLLAKAGRFSDAVVQFKKVLSVDPDNASAHLNLALAYAKSGNDAAAQPEFETACHLDASTCLARGQQ